jgi:hypothetical protein
LWQSSFALTAWLVLATGQVGGRGDVYLVQVNVIGPAGSVATKPRPALRALQLLGKIIILPLTILALVIFYTYHHPTKPNPRCLAVELKHGQVEGRCEGLLHTTCRYAKCNRGYALQHVEGLPVSTLRRLFCSM